jgi:type I restriction enzyme S subunit
MSNANDPVQKTLLDIASKDRFAIVDGPFGTQLHASEYTEEGVPVVRVVNTSYSGKFLNENIVFISETKAEKLRRSKVAPGDIIVAKTGATIGKSAIFPEYYPSGIIASSCVKLTVDKSIADSRFVAYLIQSHDGQIKIIDAAGGSTRTTINTKPFGAITFLFPSRAEQAKIAEVLSTLDLVIEQTEALLGKQQRIKTGLMQDLLTRGIDSHGKIRAETKHEFKHSALGRIPSEWNVLTLAEATSKLITYGIVQPGPHVPEGVPFVQTKDLTRGRLDVNQMDRTSAQIHANYRRSSIHVGDVLIGIRASVGLVSEVPRELDGANISRGVARLSPSKGVLGRFLFWIVQTDRVQNLIRLEIKGSTYPEITLPALRATRISVPDPMEQRRIAQIIDDADRNLTKVEAVLNKLRQLKTGLAHDLLTGAQRIRVLLAGDSGP